MQNGTYKSEDTSRKIRVEQTHIGKYNSENTSRKIQVEQIQSGKHKSKAYKMGNWRMQIGKYKSEKQVGKYTSGKTKRKTELG